MPRPYAFAKGPTSRTAVAGFTLALLSVALTGIGYAALTRELMTQGVSFRLFLGGVALSFIALAVCLMGWRRTRAAAGRKLVLTGMLISLLVLVPMTPQIVTAFRVPPIHDITTDTDNPPSFESILPLRADAPNTADYGGAALAAIQRDAYPDIAPLLLSLSPTETFSRAKKLVEERGWTLVDADEAAGRIEATAETRFMHFKDDVVIRITAMGEGSKVDMRSVSRFGRGDSGVNANRIRAFLKDLSVI